MKHDFKTLIINFLRNSYYTIIFVQRSKAIILFFFLVNFILVKNYGQETQSSSLILTNLPDSVSSPAIHFLKATNHELPLINRLEVRTEFDELDISKQDYLVRLGFNNKKEIRQQAQLHQKNIDIYKAEQALLEGDLLKIYYQYLIDWYFIQKKENLINQQQLVLEDKRNIQQKLLANVVETDIGKLIKTEKELFQLAQKSIQFVAQKQLIQHSLFPEISNPDYLLDTSNWISIQKIQTLLPSITSSTEDHLLLDLYESKIDYSLSAYSLEKIQQKKILNFTQLKYRFQDDVTFRKELTVGIGLRIPTKAMSRLQLNEITLERIENESKYQALQTDLAKELSIAHQKMNVLLDEYALHKAYVEKMGLDKLYNKYTVVAEANPLIAIEIKENLLKDQIEQLEISYKIYTQFLSILSYTGILSKQNRTNYLTENLDNY